MFMRLLPAAAAVYAALSALSAQAQAQGEFSVYVGQTNDSTGAGGFALFVDAKQKAILIGGDYVDGGNPVYASCTVVNGNGHSDIRGGTASDVVQDTVSFTIHSDGSVNVTVNADPHTDDYPWNWQVTGNVVSSGPFQAIAGYYTGSVGGLTVEGVLSPDGWFYFSSPHHGGGGRGQFIAYGQPAADESQGSGTSTFTLSSGATIGITGPHKATLTRVDPSVASVFLPAQGTYRGLFAPTNSSREQTNSGSFLLSVTSAGGISGALDLGGQSVTLSGKFGLDGTTSIVSERSHGESSLTTALQLDFTNQSVSGSVTDGSFVSQLRGDRDAFSVAHNATGFSGLYTLIIPGTNDPTAGPYGVSCGTVGVSSLGAITFAGKLADGTSIIQSSVVSKDGYWPLYVNLYSGKGSLWGWNLFTNETIVAVPALSWINGTNSSSTAVYRSGFTNQEATLTGGRYVPGNGLPGDFTVTLDGGDLPFIITNGVSITSSEKVVTNSVGDTNRLRLSITKTNGVISGTFANPSNTKQTIKVNGVILQGQTNAAGYFLGTNESGMFLLDKP